MQFGSQRKNVKNRLYINSMNKWILYVWFEILKSEKEKKHKNTVNGKDR